MRMLKIYLNFLFFWASCWQNIFYFSLFDFYTFFFQARQLLKKCIEGFKVDEWNDLFLRKAPAHALSSFLFSYLQLLNRALSTGNVWDNGCRSVTRTSIADLVIWRRCVFCVWREQLCNWYWTTSFVRCGLWKLG